jgi:hypothetical protein
MSENTCKSTWKFDGNDPVGFFEKVMFFIDNDVNVKTYAYLSDEFYTQKKLAKSKRKVIIQFNYKKGTTIRDEEHLISLAKFVLAPHTVKPQIKRPDGKVCYEEFVMEYDNDEYLEKTKSAREEYKAEIEEMIKQQNEE